MLQIRMVGERKVEKCLLQRLYACGMAAAGGTMVIKNQSCEVVE